MTLVLAPMMRVADTRPVGSALPGPFAGEGLHRRRGHTNGALGDLPRIRRRRASFTLAPLGRKSHRVTPEQPYNPHSIATASHAASSNRVYPH